MHLIDPRMMTARARCPTPDLPDLGPARPKLWSRLAGWMGLRRTTAPA